MNKIEAIVINEEGYIVEKVLCEQGNANNTFGYVLSNGEIIVTDEIEKALDMITPKYINNKWVETASQQEVEDRETQRELEQRIIERQDSIQSAIQRLAFIQAEFLPDDKASDVKALFPLWSYTASYKTGDRVQYGEALYRCLQDHMSQQSWSPDAASSLWTAISDPADEWPEWIQPTGAHNAYMKNDKVIHNGTKYVSAVDANVWEPGIYGWEAQS